MQRTKLLILIAFVVVVAALDGLYLAAVSVWLFLARGVIGCGKGVFSNSDWPQVVFELWVIPAAIFVSCIAFAFYCYRRLPFYR
jgi:hypothetical protein